jgi:DNA-binding transcriptional regulator YiaG
MLGSAESCAMPNIAAVLKAEISRVSRKEHRAATELLRKLASIQRSDIAALKRRVQALEKQLNSLARAAARRGPPGQPTSTDGDARDLRFRAQGMASNRQRLGLSAHDFGLLVGASGQSVYAWEQGKAKLRAANLTAIAALRGLGKREVASRLQALKLA